MQKFERNNLTVRCGEGISQNHHRASEKWSGQRLRKEQADYRKGRGTTDQIFILRNIIEQVGKLQATLYLTS